uniref:Uncharacterized protein n=1 Tax=Nelumbo nucifera TaxID=4432 RepID=A0A822Y8G9_NELNU|nr:TPA_asm: hypothetical protein HUJ06_029329 [Nelumbo nucifera]
MDDSCAICAEHFEWVAYEPYGRRKFCSTCVTRLRFLLDIFRIVSYFSSPNLSCHRFSVWSTEMEQEKDSFPPTCCSLFSLHCSFNPLQRTKYSANPLRQETTTVFHYTNITSRLCSSKNLWS